jgi:Zn-dependent protease with chaperone function
MKAATPLTIETRLYNGISIVPEPATLMFSGPMASVISRSTASQYPVTKLRVSPRIGTADRFVSLPDGIQLQCADGPLLDRLPQEGRTEGLVAWLEHRWWVALFSLMVTVVALLAGYFAGLPVAAEKISARIPIEYEKSLGEESLAWMDQKKLFMPSGLPSETHALLEGGFRELHQGLPMDAHYRLEFRSAPGIGANAFALPGGIIVITDEMILKTGSAEEALTVLAHEIGHVERRHVMRHVLQNSVVATVVATLTGDASSLSLAVSGLPVLLAQAKYSREFEAEADEFAFALLRQNNISPGLFADLMERLSEGRGEKRQSWSFLSSHPVTASRVLRAREAARE